VIVSTVEIDGHATIMPLTAPVLQLWRSASGLIAAMPARVPQ
jgi:hypothetical protein